MHPYHVVYKREFFKKEKPYICVKTIFLSNVARLASFVIINESHLSSPARNLPLSDVDLHSSVFLARLPCALHLYSGLFN